MFDKIMTASILGICGTAVGYAFYCLYLINTTDFAKIIGQ